jgi:hypothetical protein
VDRAGAEWERCHGNPLLAVGTDNAADKAARFFVRAGELVVLKPKGSDFSSSYVGTVTVHAVHPGERGPRPAEQTPDFTDILDG